MPDELEQIVHRDPEILGGTAVFRGTRVPVRLLFDYLEGGDTLDEFLRQFPSVRREQAIALLDLACESSRLMRLLLDRSHPDAFLRKCLVIPQIPFPVAAWSGIKNGDLLRRMMRSVRCSRHNEPQQRLPYRRASPFSKPASWCNWRAGF